MGTPLVGGDLVRGCRGRYAFMAPVLCVLAVVVTLFLVNGGSRTPSFEQEGAAVADDAAFEWGEDVRDALENVLERNGSTESSSEAFLEDIERAVEREQKQGGVAGVFWTEHQALPDAAELLLRAYQRVDDVELMSSGYLDLRGNVWGALVRSADGWVDILAVSTKDDVASEVRVVRLVPGEEVA